VECLVNETVQNDMCNNAQGKEGIYLREDPVIFLEFEVTFPPVVLQCSTVSKYSSLTL